MSNEKNVLEQNNFTLGDFAATRAMIQEEMEGLGSVPLDYVKIPSGGGLAFELPGENEDDPDISKEIVGVVVDHHPVNTYWEKDLADGGNEKPDCMSPDGKTGYTQNGEVCDCLTCPRNQFGSGKNGVGKACKNSQRLYILPSDQCFPWVLSLPPTSIPSWKNYLAKKLLLRGKRPYQVLTKVTLKKEHSDASGNDYSVAMFTNLGELPEDACQTLAAEAEGVKVLTRSTNLMLTEAAPEKPMLTEIESRELPF